MNENEQPKKQISISLVILALIFIFPLGLFLMWKGKRFNQTARIVITCLLAVACIGYVVSPKKPTETPVDKSVPEVAQTTPSAPPAEPAPQETETIPEPNTSAMVDYIVTKAKTDSETITEEQKQEAVNFIKDNFQDYFKDNDTMEKTIYYGALLEYSCEKNSDLSNLGMDAKQVVKYVYHGAEKPEDEATQANLRQIKKSLEKTENLEKVSLSEEEKATILETDKKIYQCLLNSEKITKTLMSDFEATLASENATVLDLYNLAKKAQEDQDTILHNLQSLSDDKNTDYVYACQLYVTNTKEIASNMLKYLDEQKPKYLSNIEENSNNTQTYALSAIAARMTYLADQGISDDEISQLLDSEQTAE